MFWDSSAVVPLLVAEPPRDVLLGILDQEPEMIVCRGTPVECASAIARREREGALGMAEAGQVLERLRTLTGAWHEVLPSESIRSTAQSL
ncbi:MAG TPA: type II toxin-antitoxin system VapC family toxin [Candidatus Methylomirabilis sp.]